MRRKHASVLMVFLCVMMAGPRLRPVEAADGVVLPLPSEDELEITAQFGAGVVGQALPSSPIDDTSIYFPLQERSSEYFVTAGKHKGTTQSLTVAQRSRPATEQPAWRIALSPALAGFVQQNAGGDLLMPSVADSDHDVVVVTTPANPFLLKGMKPGETRKFAQTVSVNYLDKPSQQEYRGSLDGSYTYVGTYQVTVPAGTYPAILMRLKFDGKVGPAHTQDTAYYLFAPQVGMVGMISQEDVEAFWIIHIDTTVGKVLASK